MLTYNKHIFVPFDRTLEIYFSGCSIKCPECHNPELQDETNGIKVIPEYILNDVLPYKNIAKSVHILGGEPLDQYIPDLYKLTNMLREYFNNIYLFTGYDLNQEVWQRIFISSNVDYIKLGPYIKDSDTKIQNEIKLASSNQRIIKNVFNININKNKKNYLLEIENAKSKKNCRCS